MCSFEYADREVDGRDVRPLGSRVAGLLRELAPGGRERILAGSILPAGTSIMSRPQRIAELALHDELARVGHREHRHRAGVLDPLALGRAAVGQAHRVAAHLEQLAVVDQPASTAGARSGPSRARPAQKTFDRLQAQLHQRLRQDAEREHRQPVRREEDARVELRLDRRAFRRARRST